MNENGRYDDWFADVRGRVGKWCHRFAKHYPVAVGSVVFTVWAAPLVWLMGYQLFFAVFAIAGLQVICTQKLLDALARKEGRKDG